MEQDTLTAPKWLATQQWIRDNGGGDTSSLPPAGDGDSGDGNLGGRLHVVNPSRGGVAFTLDAGDQLLEASLFDINGRRVRRWNGDAPARPDLAAEGDSGAGNGTSISWTGLPGGVYFLRVLTTRGTQEARTVVLD
ncbi:MAG: hypothetical protein R3E97_04690 [Candidatus Eisenbacteria bacterium]